MSKKGLMIAIDGPSAAGKSTVAKILAKKLNYTYIDTGAMYRCLALHALRNNIPVEDANALVEAAKKINIFLSKDNKVFLDGEDVSHEIRDVAVTAIASPVSRPRIVREVLVKKQQELAKLADGVVMDGRDIGTCVLPDAEIKIYQEASSRIRAERRFKENIEKGIKTTTIEELEEEIKQRDYSDMHKEYGSLVKADGAIVLDTSNMTIDEVVDFIYKKVMELM